MPRTIPSGMQTSVAQVITEPGYLVYIGFTSPIRHATREQITYDTYTWLAGNGTRVLSVDGNRATIALRNTDNAASTIVLSTKLSDVLCEVYQVYGSDVAQLFSGFLDGAPELGETQVILSATATSISRYAPNEYILAPTFNHLMPSGIEIRWGVDTIVMEPST